METLKFLLQELDLTLRRYNLLAYENLLPPLPDNEIEQNLKEIGINDENVKALFQWKSGTKSEFDWPMDVYGSLLAFESIKELQSLNHHHDPLLVPLISENGEEMLLLNTNPGAHYGKLYLYSVPQLYIDHPVSYFDSLAAMVKTIVEAYKENAFDYNKEHDWLDIDFPRYYEIAKKYNKNCVFWTDHDEIWWEDWYEI